MDFITIDFETANAKRESPCEIGLTFVQGRRIVETKSWLIKPMYNKFDYFNKAIHGISPELVADKPEFNELWIEIKPLVENQLLIAHNAGFDISVLCKTLELYELSLPALNYFCSYFLSKKVWKGLPAYDLKTLCKVNNIDLNHHRAGADSKAAAELTLKAFDIAGIYSINDFPEKLGTTIKQLYKSKYLAKNVGDPTSHNPESIFYDKTVVFTGTLSSMTRREAQQIVTNTGGINGNSVTKDTDFLVVGQQDYRIIGDDEMSNKQEKAVKLIEKGATLEIISEDDFLKNL